MEKGSCYVATTVLAGGARGGEKRRGRGRAHKREKPLRARRREGKRRNKKRKTEKTARSELGGQAQHRLNIHLGQPPPPPRPRPPSRHQPPPQQRVRTHFRRKDAGGEEVRAEEGHYRGRFRRPPRPLPTGKGRSGGLTPTALRQLSLCVSLLPPASLSLSLRVWCFPTATGGRIRHPLVGVQASRHTEREREAAALARGPTTPTSTSPPVSVGL